MNAVNETVVHDAASRHFTLSVDGRQARLEYECEGQLMVITHTVVPPAVGGRGIAAQLMKVALDHARKQQWKVKAACSYAMAYVRKHHEYSDLLA